MESQYNESNFRHVVYFDIFFFILRKNCTILSSFSYSKIFFMHTLLLDFVKCTEGRYYVGCSAFVKVQLADGIFHEDMGYSNFNAQDEGLATFTARTVRFKKKKISPRFYSEILSRRIFL